MKIGIDASSVVAVFGGGKEKVIMNLLKGFDEEGMDLVVFCNESASEKIVEVCPNARLVYTGMNDKVFIWKLLKGFLFRTFKLPSFVCREKVDILLFPFPATGFSRFNCPTVVIPHDVQYKSRPDENTGYKYKILDILYKFDFSNRDAIVAISEYVKNEILKHFKKDAGKVTIIYNPIEFGKPSHTAADFGADYIFANNLMHVHKNPGVLIEAFKKLSDNGWPGKLVIAGKIWPGNSNVMTLLDSEIASGRVVYEGYVNDVRMRELLSGACLFINPS
ncbi:MAG TPA: glycosyltransferase, partial [Clostridia bacterium]|nr:glycosyltransferase [Clostridia bacterium]